MDTIIVYADDAQYAQPLLQSMAQAPTAGRTHWIIVACAPRVTHRVSKFASNRSRENWRNKWADKLFESSAPLLEPTAGKLTTLLAKGPLAEVLADLQAQHGEHVQVVDLRRPKLAESSVAVLPCILPKLGGTLAGLGAIWTMLLGEALAA
ncbi:MAG: hypothetical protein KBT18_06720 [Comamonas sp.]|nr:hypothetical protein [Candidatus Comamonas equi]